MCGEYGLGLYEVVCVCVSYLALDVYVLEHLCDGSDVFLPHVFTAAHLDGLANPPVHLPRARTLRRQLIGQLDQGAIGEGRQDLTGGKVEGKCVCV